MRSATFFLGILTVFALAASADAAEDATHARATRPAAHAAIDAAHLLQPDDLAKTIRAAKGDKPLVLMVGFHVLYAQAHIPGAEFAGPASEEKGMQQLRARVNALPRHRSIVLYCGCCPWEHCPNVEPAYKELRAMGFSNVKVLYLANNFGTDWMSKGYPVEKGS